MSVIILNVGGVHFYTNRSTLASSNCFFSGLIAHTDEGCTELFVDRDPTNFRYILNWLRGVRVLPEDWQTCRELQWEADFYGMLDLTTELKRTRERHSPARSFQEIAKQLELMRRAMS